MDVYKPSDFCWEGVYLPEYLFEETSSSSWHCKSGMKYSNNSKNLHKKSKRDKHMLETFICD